MAKVSKRKRHYSVSTLRCHIRKSLTKKVNLLREFKGGTENHRTVKRRKIVTYYKVKNLHGVKRIGMRITSCITNEGAKPLLIISLYEQTIDV